MAKYLINSTDVEIEEVSGTENLKFNLAPGNSVEQMIGDLSNLNTTSKSNVVNAINEVNSSTIYSTTETVVGKWIDNNSIYRKVINIGNLPNATTKSVSTGITNLNYVTHLYGIAMASGGFIALNDTYPGDATYDTRISYNKTNGTVDITTAFDRSNYSGYVIVEYTKN